MIVGKKNNVEAIDTLSLDLTTYLAPILTLMVSLFIGLWLKDWLSNLMNGLKFKMDPSFGEGDRCIVDGDRAIIVKIGVYETVFSIHNGRGHVWRYVPNERIKFLKIEKVIEEPKS
tara:strand:- start:1398 stop:1745 length:348 start_codon:yes stop_codon:yes gene_type:complete